MSPPLMALGVPFWYSPALCFWFGCMRGCPRNSSWAHISLSPNPICVVYCFFSLHKCNWWIWRYLWRFHPLNPSRILWLCHLWCIGHVLDSSSVPLDLLGHVSYLAYHFLQRTSYYFNCLDAWLRTGKVYIWAFETRWVLFILTPNFRRKWRLWNAKKTIC